MARIYRSPMRLSFIALAVALLCIAPGARGARSQQGEGDARIDYVSARREIQAFETVLNNIINATFSSSSFALVQKAKGAYLPGYGMSFSFLINIHRAMINTPFGEIRRWEDVTPEQKRKRIEELMDKLVRALQQSGDTFRQLRKEEGVTIVAFYEDRNFPDEANHNKTVVMSATKRDLEDFAGKEDRQKEFRQRMKIIEY